MGGSTWFLHLLVACAVDLPADTAVDLTFTDGDGDGIAHDFDRDDDDPAVHPGAGEACDGADNDCDGRVDEVCNAPSGESSLSDAAAVFEGPSGAVGTAAGRSEGADHAVFAMSAMGTTSDDCSLYRVYVYDAPVLGTQGIGEHAVATLSGDDTVGCVGGPDLSASGDDDGVDDLLFVGYNGNNASVVLRGPVDGERSLASADLLIETELDNTLDAAWLGDVDGVAGAEIGVSGLIAHYDAHYLEQEVQIFSALDDGTLSGDDAIGRLRVVTYDVYWEWLDAVGDLDGDGLDDIVVDGGWFYYGPLTGERTDEEADLTLASDHREGQYTLHAEKGGDVDGDGLDDAVVAVIWDLDTVKERWGAVVVTDGDRAVTRVDELAIRLEAPVSEGDFNSGLATGDVDGDGTRDIVLGGAGPNGSGVEEPAIHLEYGPFAGVRQIGGGAVFTVGPDMDSAGAALSVGDFDGDGFDDILAGGSPEERDGLGAAWIVLGGPP